MENQTVFRNTEDIIRNIFNMRTLNLNNYIHTNEFDTTMLNKTVMTWDDTQTDNTEYDDTDYQAYEVIMIHNM